jgi:hypothetical protein
MTRHAFLVAPLVAPLLAGVLVTLSPACSKSEKDLVVVGDPAAAASGEKAITVGQLLMNTSAAFDKTVKLKAELGEKGNVVDGYMRLMVVSASGPFEVRVAEKYQAAVDKLKPPDAFIAVGQISSVGPETNPHLVFQVD